MGKYLYKISEVAEQLGESVSLVRYWSNEFEQFVKPQRNAKGNRMYTEQDIEMLKQIYRLVKIEGQTLEGAAKTLKGGRKDVLNRIKVVERLTAIREQLVEIRASL
ncbi:MAG: MerR family transcriptional regulator [Candidatus Cryptobacteroides sp.]